MPVTVIDRLGWSWRNAWEGFRSEWWLIDQLFNTSRPLLMVIGLLFAGILFIPSIWRALLFFLIGVIAVLGGIAFLFSVIGTFLKGIQAIEEPKLRTSPNQGIRSTAGNMILAVVVVSMGSAFVLAATYAVWSVFNAWLISEVVMPYSAGEDYWLIAGAGALIGAMLGSAGGTLAALPAFGAGSIIGHLMLRSAAFRAQFAPWNYAAFLGHCVERILMRQVGGGFVFLHLTLRDHFADRHAATQPSTEPKPEQ